MSKAKEKLQQLSSPAPPQPPSSTTTITAAASSSSSLIELKNQATQAEDKKKSKDDEISKMKRKNNDDQLNIDDDDDDDGGKDQHRVVKKEYCGGYINNNNNNNKPKTLENNRNRKKLKDVNDVITCYLCHGYYIEATTINECLHSFCRSCIVQYLQKSKYCPKCKSFNKSINITNLRPDVTLRTLVYKLVPGLCQSEIQRLVRFNSNNSASSSSSSSAAASLSNPMLPPAIGGNDLNNDLWDFYSPDEMISLSLEYHIHSVIGEQDDISSISLIRYLKCPAAVTVHHLQRFISSKFNLKPASKFSIEIIYEDEILPEDFSLMDVAYCYKWERLLPMQFFYRIFVKPEKSISKPVAKCKKVQSISEQPSPGDDTETFQHITTPTTTTIVSTNNNNNNNNNNFSNNDTTNNSNSNKNISNNDNNNVNNGDNNNNNNNNNNKNDSSSSNSSSNVKVESSKTKEKVKEIKKEIQDEVQVKKENNSNSNDNSNNNDSNNSNNNNNNNNNSNKIPNNNKSPVSVSPPQPPNDFKILRSNDIRYAITTSSVERPVEVPLKKSNNEKRSKLSIKIERTQSHDDCNNNNNNGSKQNEDVVASSPIKRRASASNSITLKRKYNKTDDEDDTGSKKSRGHHHHHHHYHQKYVIVQSPKILDDETMEMGELNVPKIKLDLPNLKAKIKVPKLELSSKDGGLKSPLVTSSSSSNSSSPRCNNDDLFVENQAKYSKTSESTTDQISSSHHHKHHHGDTSSSHKKRKKSKHSKDSPAEEISSNGNGNNGYSSNGNSKKRKIHAEISPQTEKSQDDLKLKFKINYKPAEKPKPPVIPTMVIDDDSNDKIVKTPTSPRIIMTLPVPPVAPVTVPAVTSSNSSPPLITTATSTTCSLILPKPSIMPSMPTLFSTNMSIPTPTISNSISQDVEEVIKRNKIKKTNIDMPHRMSPNTEEILNEMRAIHSATQAAQKPMVNIPHLSQVHLQNNDPIYGSKSPDMKNSNPMLVSIRNTNPITTTSSSALRHQLASNSRPQMNFTLMPGKQQKHGTIKPHPFNFSAATFANNTYNHPRTPFPILKSINLQRKSCYDIDPIDKKSPQKSGASTSIFDFPSEPIGDFFSKKDKNQKRITPPTLTSFDEPISSIINSMTKTSMAIELRGKNLFPVTTTATTTTSSAQTSSVKSELPFVSSMGNSFISENQNSRTPIQPIQLPPASVSVTNVTNKVTSKQLQNQQHHKHSSGDHKPVVEILRIQSSTPAVDQQMQPQKVKPNRPPPPLIKRPQVIGVSNAANQQRRPSASAASEAKKIENNSRTSASSPKVERKSSSETKEPPMCDNIGALDLSGKSSRSPSLEKSPISKSSSRSNSTEDEFCFNTTIASAITTTPPKISLSKQKKITDMFPSSAWSVKVENNGSMNISSSDRGTAGKSEITITSTGAAPTPSTLNPNIATSKPPPPKLTEISKLRTYSNSTKSIPTTSATTITSVRQQNLSIRNVPNPSALAFRNQISPNPISSNNNNSGSCSSSSNNNNNNSNNNNNTMFNGNNANNNKTKVNEGKEIEKVIAHLKANAAADNSSKTGTN